MRDGERGKEVKVQKEECCASVHVCNTSEIRERKKEKENEWSEGRPSGSGGVPSSSFLSTVLLQTWRSSKKLGACSTLSIQKWAKSVFSIPPPTNLVPLCVILPQIRVPTKHSPL
ncbi:hypothetical protein Csa_009363 [Cucumis sativus]|uniref:Uncharacterized protein n=1 Tax=Cucumis sativus TaxID=3659 RepID=A0A0A0KRP3_CUCSA|nr:hypothetical protein Csa_009363 [Cucumis sativus]